MIELLKHPYYLPIALTVFFAALGGYAAVAVGILVWGRRVQHPAPANRTVLVNTLLLPKPAWRMVRVFGWVLGALVFLTLNTRANALVHEKTGVSLPLLWK